MRADELIKKLEKAGFEQSRAYKIANINTEGGYLVGEYLGTVEYEDDDGKTKVNHKFKVEEGIALLTADAKTPEKIEKDEEVVIFGSGLLTWILANKHKTGDKLAVVYKGREPYKYGKKKVMSHRFEVMALATK